MVGARAGERELEVYGLMGSELQFCKMQRVLEMDGGKGHKTK